MTRENAKDLGMIDARERVTGEIDYTINLELPNMAHAKLLRSIYPHARIVRLDVSRAAAVPGVLAVVTGHDLAARTDLELHFGPIFRDQPILALDTVRFVGDPVAAVVADDLDAAQQALDLIEVEYEELPAVFTVDAALEPGAPLVHEEPPQVGPTFKDVIIHPEPGTNICTKFTLRKGDIEQGFAEADAIFEDTFSSPAVQHVPMETHACIARVERGQITVWTGSQTPHAVRSQLSETFGVPLSRVRVIVPTLGGGYGAKAYSKIEPVAAALSLLAHRPVRLHLTREEEFVTITKHAVVIRMKTGVRKDGTIVARQSTCLFNTGAYADIGPRLIKNGGYGTGGPHAIPHVWIDSYAVYTNTPPAGAFRGYGISQAAWAYETQMDMIAERMGWDPYEFRMTNLLTNGETFCTGEPMHDCHFRELLTDAASHINWDPTESVIRVGNKVRAKGITCIIKSTVTPSTSTSSMKLNEDGSVNVLTSAVEMGQGVKTALAILTAERLDLLIQNITVSEVDTDITPYDQQTSSSRATYSMGNAVLLAADDIRRQLLEHASSLMEVGPDDLEITQGTVRVKGVPHRVLSFGEIVRATRSGNLLASSTFKTEGGLDPETGQGIASVHWHQSAGAVEIEVDLETGKIDVLRYYAHVYAGRVVNPVQAELQIEGGIIFGLGQALFEEMLFDNGQLQNGNLGDYMIPSIEDVPERLSAVVEERSGADMHGLGEPGLPPVMPAIGNAVYRATGVRIRDLPITPEKILRGLRGEQEKGGIVL